MKWLMVLLTVTGIPVQGSAAQLLVLNKSDATLMYIDPASGTNGGTVVTGTGPHEVEVSSDGRLAFVSNYGDQTPGHSLSVIDVASRKEVKRVDLGELRRPHGLSFAGGNLYVTTEVGQRIVRYNPEAQRVDWTFDTAQEGTHMVLASRDASQLFAANIGSNSIGIVQRNASGEWAQTLVKVGAGPEGLDLSADGRTLWTAHSRDGGISIIDVATAKVTHTFDAKTQRSNRVKLTPDGRLALISDLAAGELVIFDARDYSERARLELGRTPTGILVAPSGDQAFVAVSGDDRIAVIDLETSSVSRTIATGKQPNGMAWVP